MAERQKDEYGLFEVLHISNFLLRGINHELLEHPLIKGQYEWSTLAHVASDALATLYHAIEHERTGNCN
jgi:hypothetical protein